MTREEAIDCLGLPDSPSKEEILNAYRNLAKKVHPDIGGTDFLFKQISNAKEILLGETTQEKRSEHKKKPTWEEIVYQKNFTFSEEELEKLLILDEVVHKQYSYQGDIYNIRVTPKNIYYEHFDLKVPITCEIYHWNSVLKWLFQRKPTKEIQNGSVSAKNRAFEIFIGAALKATLDRGVYEIVFHVLGQTETIRLRIGRKPSYRKKKEQVYENSLFNTVLRFEAKINTGRRKV